MKRTVHGYRSFAPFREETLMQCRRRFTIPVGETQDELRTSEIDLDLVAVQTRGP